jgi:hypothetical protein
VKQVVDAHRTNIWGAVWLARAMGWGRCGLRGRRASQRVGGEKTRADGIHGGATRVGVIRGCGRKTRVVANIAGGGTVGWWTPSVAP